jgi:carboxylesterase type B
MAWVRDNAAAFHGDPNRVMIFGESAGAGSVSNHLVAPRSGGLFNAAIMESGPIAALWVAQSLTVAEHQFATLVASTGCGGGSGSPVPCLRALNATVLEKHRPQCPGSLLDWAPTVSPLVSWALSHHEPSPIMSPLTS